MLVLVIRTFAERQTQQYLERDLLAPDEATPQNLEKFLPEPELVNNQIYYEIRRGGPNLKEEENNNSTVAEANASNTSPNDTGDNTEEHILKDSGFDDELSLKRVLPAFTSSVYIAMILISLLVVLMSSYCFPFTRVLTRLLGGTCDSAERPAGNIYRLMAVLSPDTVGQKTYQRLKWKTLAIAVTQLWMPVQILTLLIARYGAPRAAISAEPPPIHPLTWKVCSAYIFWWSSVLARLWSLIMVANVFCEKVIQDLIEEATNDSHLLMRRLPNPGETRWLKDVFKWLRDRKRNGVALSSDHKLAYLQLLRRMLRNQHVTWVPEKDFLDSLDLPSLRPKPGETWPRKRQLPADEELPAYREGQSVQAKDVAVAIAVNYMIGRDGKESGAPPREVAGIRQKAVMLLVDLLHDEDGANPQKLAVIAILKRSVFELKREISQAERMGDNDRASGLEEFEDEVSGSLYLLSSGEAGENNGVTPCEKEPVDSGLAEARESWWIFCSIVIALTSGILLEVSAYFKLCTVAHSVEAPSGDIEEITLVIMALLWVADLDDLFMKMNPEFKSLYRCEVLMQIADQSQEDGDDSGEEGEELEQPVKVPTQYWALFGARAIHRVGVPVARLVSLFGILSMVFLTWTDQITGRKAHPVLSLT